MKTKTYIIWIICLELALGGCIQNKKASDLEEFYGKYDQSAVFSITTDSNKYTNKTPIVIKIVNLGDSPIQLDIDADAEPIIRVFHNSQELEVIRQSCFSHPAFRTIKVMPKSEEVIAMWKQNFFVDCDRKKCDNGQNPCIEKSASSGSYKIIFVYEGRFAEKDIELGDS